MRKIIDSLKSYIKNIDKHTLLRIGLFLIPLVGIVFKGIVLQGFIQSENPYSFNFALGYSKASYFLPYYFSYALILLSFSLLFKGKGRIIYLFVIDIIVTILTLIDVAYFRGFLTMPSILLLTQTANLDNMGGSILSMFSPLDILFLLDIIILGIYVFFTRKSYSVKPKRAIKTFLLSLIIPLIYVVYIPFNIHVLKNEDVSGAYLFDGYDPTNTARYFSSIGYHIIDMYTVYNDSKAYQLTDEDKAQIDEYYKWKQENLPDNEYAGISKNKNLIIIQVESLETFAIGQEINGKKLTPVMDEIMKNSLYFPNIYEQVNEGTSSDSDLMVNTSMLPLRRGSTFFRYPNAVYNSLPILLKNEGYTTASIHPDKGSFWNYANGLKGGIAFEHFIDQFSFDISDQIGMGLSDKSYFNQVIPILKEFKEPFYAHTITLTNHGPFDLPADLRKLSLDPTLDKSELGGYFESVHYTDAAIGEFIAKLDSEGLLENSVIAIVGDHTGVHKYYNHGIEQLPNKENWYSDNGNPTVPLIIYDKNISEAKTFETIGGQIDIMPTLLYILGVDSSKYNETALGRNLLNTNKNYAVLTNGTVKGFDLSTKDEEIIKNSLEISDKMIRGDYFNKNK